MTTPTDTDVSAEMADDPTGPIQDQAGQHRTTSSRRKWLHFAQSWLVFIVCLLLWQWAAASAGSAYFPTPLTIGQTMRDLWFSGPANHLFLTASVGNDVLPSLGRLLAGWAISGVLGAAVGLLLGLSGAAADYAGPMLSFLRAMPPVMLIPVFMVLFQLGTPMELATIIFGTIWPVLLNAVDGARSVDDTKLETAHVFRISRARRIFGIVLPAALPKIFAGLRISLSLALILMVLSEMIGSDNGIGYELVQQQKTFHYPEMWAGIVLISILGYLLNRLLLIVEHQTLGWHRGAMRLED